MSCLQIGCCRGGRRERAELRAFQVKAGIPRVSCRFVVDVLSELPAAALRARAFGPASSSRSRKATHAAGAGKKKVRVFLQRQTGSVGAFYLLVGAGEPEETAVAGSQSFRCNDRRI